MGERSPHNNPDARGEHAGKNLSAYIEGAPVITVGNDIKEIEDNMKEAIELYLEDNPNPWC